MHNNPTPSFDADLIVCPLDPISSFTGSEAYISEGDRLRRMNKPEKNLVYTGAMYKRIVNDLNTYGVLEKEYSNRLQKTANEVPRDVAQLLVEGRLRCLYVLNTYGGLGTNYETYQDVTTDIVSRSGEVHALGGRSVMSAGALTLILAPSQHRYIMPYTNIMFHLGSMVSEPEHIYETSDNPDFDPDDIMDSYEEDRQEEIELLRKIFTTEFISPIREKLLAAVDRIPLEVPKRGEANNNREFYFSSLVAHCGQMARIIRAPGQKITELTGIEYKRFPARLRKILANLKSEDPITEEQLSATRRRGKRV